MERAGSKRTLSHKMVALFLVLGVSFALGGYLALRFSVLPVFAEFEREFAENTFARVEQAMDSDFKELAIINKEYSLWNETYYYALKRNPDYDENLGIEYWQSIDIDLLLIFDANGNQLYARLGHPADGSQLLLEDELFQPLVPTHPLVSHESLEHSYKGFLQTRSGTVEVASYPILKTDGTGPIAGSFVIGRFLTDDRAADFGKRATAAVKIHSANPEGSPFETAPAIAIQELLASGQVLHSEITDTSIIHYRLIRDAFDKPAAVLEVSTPRRITQIGSAAVRMFMAFQIEASIILVVCAWLFMQRLIVSPISILKGKMLGIRHTGNLDIVVDTDRSDEIGLLAGEFKELTSRLSQARKESEMARQASEKSRDEAVAMSRSKSEFLARMSHEIRTPMNGVLGMTELLQDTQLNPKQRRFAQTIYDSAESLLDIINDILDFSKIEAGKLRLDLLDVDLHNLLEETVDSLANLAHRKNLELINIAPLNLNTNVQADPGRLRQVLTNLVGNAIKFTEKGEVVLRVSAIDIDAENVEVLFEVEDTGIGIKPEKQKIVFDSFTQVDGTTTRLYGGTGLGLTVCKQLVDLMGGDLTVISAPGKGSTFSFSLPMRKGSEADCRRLPHPELAAGARILIVDDNATNREMLERQLTTWRASTDSAASAADALGILESAVASGNPHDLAILDIHMPYEDGMELIRAIRNNPALTGLKLIALSSLATPPSDDALANLNIAGQLTKPIRQSQLYDSLVAVLGGQTLAQSYSGQTVRSVKALTGRVLLAEDNPVNQAVATGMLEKMGLSVTLAKNGQEAIRKASGGRFDVILMDCQMPKVDGFQATKAIRRMESESGKTPTPIIAATANALKGAREQCLAAGMDDYLTKPFTSEQLHSVLSLYLQPGTSARSTSLEAAEEKESPIGTSLESGSPLDSKVLDGLARLQQPGAPNIIEKVIEIYLQSSRELKDRLRGAVQGANAALVRESAHALKSSSLNVGALGLADLCKRLEKMGREGNLSDVLPVHERFEKEFERVIAALKLEIASSTA